MTQQLGAAGAASSSGAAEEATTTTWPPTPGWGHLLTRAMVVEHVGGSQTDAYNNAQQTVTALDYVHGYIEPLSEALHLLEADTMVTTHQVVLPPQIKLTAEDRVIVDGTTYRVIEAMLVTNARTGAPHHVEGRVLEQTG